MSDERITPEMIRAASAEFRRWPYRATTDHDPAWASALTAVYPLIERDVIRRLAEQAGENPWAYLSSADPTDPANQIPDTWAEGAAAGVAAERERSKPLWLAAEALLDHCALFDPAVPMIARDQRGRLHLMADLRAALSDDEETPMPANKPRDGMKLTCVYCGAARPGEQYPYCPSCGRCHRA